MNNKSYLVPYMTVRNPPFMSPKVLSLLLHPSSKFRFFSLRIGMEGPILDIYSMYDVQ